MAKLPQDLTGQTINHLTAIKLIKTVDRPNDPTRTYAVWLWQCQCGKQVEILAHYVKRGFKKSCGCHVRRGQSVPAWNTYNKNYADGDLTFERFQQLSQSECYYCGAPPSNKRRYHGHVYIYNGLNRIDHTQPHDYTNVRPCCWSCNQRISDWHEDEFFQWINKVMLRHLQSKIDANRL